MLKGIYTPPGGEPEPVTIIQFIGTPTHAVFLRSDGTLSEAEISWLSNVHEELVSSVSKMSSLTHRQRDVLRYLAKPWRRLSRRASRISSAPTRALSSPDSTTLSAPTRPIVTGHRLRCTHQPR